MFSFFSVKQALLLVLCSSTAMLAQGSPTQYGTNDPVGYRQNGEYQNDPGYRRGFDDGTRSGQNDAQSGKRHDPAKTESYEDTPGYDSSYGDKGQWKQQYRQGYLSGYQRAMYGGANGGYGPRPYGQGAYGQSQSAGDEGYRRGFDDGMQSGRTDAQRGKRGDPVKSEHYEDAPGYSSSYGEKAQWKQQYREGFTAGYERAQGQGWTGQAGSADGRRYSDDDRPRNNGNDPAYQRGYQDGLGDGQKDARKNKRNSDITKSEHYKDAPGYNSSFGSKDQWKAAYRQGYAAGYQQTWDGYGRR